MTQQLTLLCPSRGASCPLIATVCLEDAKKRPHQPYLSECKRRLIATQAMSSACLSPCAKRSTAENRLETSSPVLRVRMLSSVSDRRESPNSSPRGLRASVTPSVNRMRLSPGFSCTQEASAGRSVKSANGSPVDLSLRGSPETGISIGAQCPQLQYSRVPLAKFSTP